MSHKNSIALLMSFCYSFLICLNTSTEGFKDLSRPPFQLSGYPARQSRYVPPRKNTPSPLFIVCALIACFFASFFVTILIVKTSQASTTSFNNLAVSTPSPLPATLTPNTSGPLESATLGGTPASFAQKYGNAIGNGSIFETTQDGLKIDFVLTGAKGKDGKTHINVINIIAGDGNGNSTPLPSQTSATLIKALLPPDAKHLQDVPSGNFIDHVYMSQRLSQTFDASIFISDAGGSVPSGTLDWLCLGTDSSGASDSCLLSTGKNAK
jgi:hypothetical protein